MIHHIARHMRAATEPPQGGEVGKRLASLRASLHTAYLNEVLGDYYCRFDGQEWPCLPYRQANTCKCSHDVSVHEGGTGECWSTACGCTRLRLPGGDAA